MKTIECRTCNKHKVLWECEPLTLFYERMRLDLDENAPQIITKMIDTLNDCCAMTPCMFHTDAKKSLLKHAYGEKTMFDKYYPITRKELDQIKNDCEYPEESLCDGCKSLNEHGCTFKGANILMDEVLERRDPFEILLAWADRMYELQGDIEIVCVKDFVKDLRDHPERVIERGIDAGWLK